MSSKDVRSRVIAVVAEHFGVNPEEIADATSIVGDLNADSLDQVELLMELEDEFEMSIPDRVAEGILTVGQIIAHIEQNTPKIAA